MNVRFRHHAWLLTGGVVAVVLAWSGIASAPGGTAAAAAALGLALHFRSHATRLARRLEERRRSEQERRRRLQSVADDLERSRHVIKDNLQEIVGDPSRPATQLYAEGIDAHASRLGDLGRRIRHIADGDEDSH